MYSNLKLLPPELVALYEPLFLEMQKYAENHLDDLNEDTAFKYFKTIAANCNKKAIPKEIYFILAKEHLDFDEYEDDAIAATENAYKYTQDCGLWLRAKDKVNDPSNPFHIKSNKKGKEKIAVGKEEMITLSKSEHEQLLDIKGTLWNFLPFLCFNEHLEKNSIIIFSCLSEPKTMEEIIDFGSTIDLNEEQVDFIVSHLHNLDVIDLDDKSNRFYQKSHLTL